jgi:alpha-tubulin suppressor-like RCC1 family protein
VRVFILLFAVGCGAKTPLNVGEVPAATSSKAIVAISVGEAHACALQGGEVWCWGRNDMGQLGDDSFVDRKTPVRVVDLSGVAQIAAGRHHTCARLSDGSLRCWGQRQVGQLGDGASLVGTTLLNIPKPTYVANVDESSFVAAGSAHTCTITSGGTRCFGSNDFGELGDGRTQRSSVATAVLDVSESKELALGAAHSCARDSAGGVSCWGQNDGGQLGALPAERCGSSECARRALSVSMPGEAASIAAAANRTCAVLTDGQVACWGQWMRGPDFFPELVPGLTDVAQIALGASHTCVRKTDNSVWCWGEGDRGQLGYIVNAPCPRGAGHCSLTPTRVLDATSIALGGDSSCALMTDGAVRCWGRNDKGQLGDGSTVDSLTPVTVAGIGAK